MDCDGARYADSPVPIPFYYIHTRVLPACSSFAWSVKWNIVSYTLRTIRSLFDRERRFFSCSTPPLLFLESFRACFFRRKKDLLPPFLRAGSWGGRSDFKTDSVNALLTRLVFVLCILSVKAVFLGIAKFALLCYAMPCLRLRLRSPILRFRMDCGVQERFFFFFLFFSFNGTW